METCEVVWGNQKLQESHLELGFESWGESPRQNKWHN